MRRTITIVLVVALGASGNLFAQDKPTTPDWKAAIVLDMVEAATGAAKQNQPSPFTVSFGRGARQQTAMYLVAANAKQTAYGKLLTALEAARVDKQVGAAPASKGGTSLAMKGLAPRILGFAVERGALTREVSGTSMTFRVSPVGLVKALQSTGIEQLNGDYLLSGAQRLAGRASLAATFDVSRGSTPGTFTGDAQQLSAWAARYTIINRRDPAAPENGAEWQTLFTPALGAYEKSVGTINDALGNWTEYTAWETAMIKDVTDKVQTPYAANKNLPAALETFQKVLTADLKKLEALAVPKEVTAALDSYVAELGKTQLAIGDIYKFIGKGALVTLDVTDSRDDELPDLYTVTGVFEAGLGASRKTDLTVNGAFSTYTKKPTGIDHSLKSIDLTAQVDRPLGPKLQAAIATIAVRYSYLPNDTAASTGASAPGTSLAPAAAASATATAPKGHIGVIQGKLTIPVKDSGMKVPVSVTASNRTELIKEKDVRGSIGLTVDFDVLMSALAGSFH